MLTLEYYNWINGRKENFPYISPVPKDAPEDKRFPIFASGLEYNYDTVTPVKLEIYKGAADCGFNVCILPSVGMTNPLKGNLQNAEEAKVNILFRNNYFLTDSNSIESIKKSSNLKDYINRIGGINFYEEPTYKMLNGDDIFIKESTGLIFTMPQSYKLFMVQDPPFMAYFNLVSFPGNDDYLEGIPESSSDRYGEYLNKFQELYKPAVFSYDIYPINEYSALLHEGMGDRVYDTNNEGKITVEYDNLFEDLNRFSKLSRSVNRPFWTFTQSMFHMFSNTANIKPIALEQYLRFEAFISLAYGSKGIIYWTYGMRPNSLDEKTGNLEVYFSALLNRRDEKTASWYFAKKINEEIQKYSDIFLNGTIDSVDIVESKLFNSYPFIIGFYTETAPNDKLNDDKRVKIIITKISHNKNTYFLIVNIDALNYHTLNINVQGNNIYELTPETSKGEINTLLKKGDHERVLIPGGYRIFKTYLF